MPERITDVGALPRRFAATLFEPLSLATPGGKLKLVPAGPCVVMRGVERNRLIWSEGAERKCALVAPADLRALLIGGALRIETS